MFLSHGAGLEKLSVMAGGRDGKSIDDPDWLEID
jgi:hypothetical protein